jgi:hypothetical protein
VFLGLTLLCARCHEHKFDPISQDEFYGLYAFFNSNEEPGLYSQQPDSNRAFEPFLAVPSPDQARELAALDEKLTALRVELDVVDPAESQLEDAFFAEISQNARWSAIETKVDQATSSGNARLRIAEDQSVIASENNPATDVHTLTLRTDARDLNLIALEALTDPGFADGRVGRAPNGNAVLTQIEAEAISIADPGQRQRLNFRWAWASHEQANGDYAIVNAIDLDPKSGWAVAGHLVPGARWAVFATDQPFGYDGGTKLVVRLSYESMYPQHVLGKIRLSLGHLADGTAAGLPAASSGWYVCGPFASSPSSDPYKVFYGPEKDAAGDLTKEFAEGNRWRLNLDFKDTTRNKLAAGTNVSYVARRLVLPAARTIKVSLGSDDGFELFVNGQSVRQRNVERALAPDQDIVEVPLVAGANWLVLKIVNTGGDAGFYYREENAGGVWPRDLIPALVPPSAVSEEGRRAARQAWRTHSSPAFRRKQAAVAELEQKKTAIAAQTPLTMVMKELPQARPAYLLKRGVYDKPDMARPAARSIPAALGSWPPDAPRNRLGLAQWLTSADNPLVARVAVNRLWEHFFGAGLVRTSEDFGLQGEWPSHPELLDWLAVEFRESGWDVQHLIRLIVTSRTYQQASRVRPDVRKSDPDNRWLAYFPRRRLTAEQLRDQALYVSGLLVEKSGGPSVKPYQPEGIWAEVAMLQSNTRNYQQGQGPDLWRRSMYTYWKRACPPPSLQTFDAPTRESCTIRRSSTNTPLQALVLWNDPQFVEAARVLAQRTLMDPASDDAARISIVFRRCVGRAPDAEELAALSAALEKFRARYQAAASDASNLVAIGAFPKPDSLPVSELAAWTLLANAVLNFTEALFVD